MPVERAVRIVRRHGGVARTRLLRRAGVSKRALAAAVHSGSLVRPRQGVYALPASTEARREALSHRGALACVSAARDHGLWTLDDGAEEQTHTWVDPGRHPTRFAVDAESGAVACCVLHRDASVGEPELHRVSVVHCLVQIHRCRGDEAFFAALESALRQGLLDEAGRRTLEDRLPDRARWLVDFARCDADSGLESLLRLRLHRLGISLASQVPIPGVGIVDFVIGDRLILEADGKTHDGDSRHTDRVRDAVAVSLGFIPLRFDSALILHDWPLVEAAILAALSDDLHISPAGRQWAGN
ncbi:MAG TPA: type IV toxin-antitoxin system AbiEi family antitoxin domain-containing protein [Microbacterium sp.]|nr:type IV toxin-antitoxin system AbiEi family antitoxin domain-containing protein [Microbacterium sp.]